MSFRVERYISGDERKPLVTISRDPFKKLFSLLFAFIIGWLEKKEESV